jgi:hypothetical protein
MKEIAGSTVFVIVAIIIVGLVISYPVMLLWNGCLVGVIAGISTITWMQAWGILILIRVLFNKVELSRK